MNPTNLTETKASTETNLEAKKIIDIVIDDQPVSVPEGTTIHEAAEKLGIFIPTLCSHPDLHHSSDCRVCVVEVEGMDTLQTSCDFQITKPIRVRTDTLKIIRSRENIIDLFFLSTAAIGISITAAAMGIANCRRWPNMPTLPCIYLKKSLNSKSITPAIPSSVK
jgi:predicted molibdopterin-dependent oxidoreductase YjgC